ncbi:MAG: Nif3-like dinuclear metal center hexameric protein [Planctomycetaceae bacterium]|nr:Nif3-like dinuclear metal center hexameric protein [Planctomycetaceae bacterium]
MSLTASTIVDTLRSLAPPELAEPWDNVGLLLGDASQPVERVLTCLTLSSDVADEAVDCGAQLIVSHHPVLFRAVKSLTTATAEGRTLLKLLAAGIAVYSPHTAYDSSTDGINAQLAAAFGLMGVTPLRPATLPNLVTAGGGRVGTLPRPLPLADFLQHIKSTLKIDRLQYATESAATISRVAVACGSAAEFISDAVRAGCQALVTGEARFHACLEARDAGLVLVLAGHYATERPGVEQLARMLVTAHPGLSAQASARESDPVLWSV